MSPYREADRVVERVVYRLPPGPRWLYWLAAAAIVPPAAGYGIARSPHESLDSGILIGAFILVCALLIAAGASNDAQSRGRR